MIRFFLWWKWCFLKKIALPHHTHTEPYSPKADASLSKKGLRREDQLHQSARDYSTRSKSSGSSKVGHLIKLPYSTMNGKKRLFSWRKNNPKKENVFTDITNVSFFFLSWKWNYPRIESICTYSLTTITMMAFASLLVNMTTREKLNSNSFWLTNVLEN